MTEQTLENPLTEAVLNTALSQRALTALDRCDRCGAQAYVNVSVTDTSLDLMFCGHHWKKVENNSKFIVLRDERAKLTERPAVNPDSPF